MLYQQIVTIIIKIKIKQCEGKGKLFVHLQANWAFFLHDPKTIGLKKGNQITSKLIMCFGSSCQ